MKKLACSFLLLLVALTSCSATLNVRCTAPSQDNAGTCSSRVLTPQPAGNLMKIHFAWTGVSSGEDSVSALPGSPVSFSRQVSAGTYSVRAWASDAGGVGCDTTITVSVKDPPDRVKIP